MGFKCFSNELKNLELFKKAGGVFTSWLHVTINPLAVVVVQQLECVAGSVAVWW